MRPRTYDGGVTDATRTTAANSAVDTLYEDDKALDVIGYLISLKRFIVPAAVVAALVLVLGSVYALTRPDTYVANATVSLIPGPVETEAEATQQAAMLPMVARSYSQLANSPLVLDPVAAQLDPSGELTGSDLAQTVRIGWPSNSLVLTFAVTADSSEQAVQRVKAVAESFTQRVPQATGETGGVLLGAKVIYLQEGPIDPEASTTPELLAVSFVGGLAVGFLTAVALDLTIGRRQRRRALATA